MPYTTLALKNGKIYTMDGKIAEAVAVSDDIIVKVGSNEEIEPYISSNTEIIDLKGNTLVPGFNDTHTHLVGYGCSLTAANLENVNSKEELRERLCDYIEKNKIPQGEWVLGRGWNQNFFPDKSFPDKTDLDRVSKNHPILIIRTCGHIGIVNSAGLNNVGVNKEMFIEGGSFDKGDDGEPNGVIREASLEWFKKNKKSKQNNNEIKRAIINGGNALLKYGITTIHTEDSYDLGYGGDFMDIYNSYQELIAQGSLPVRIYQKIALPTGKAIDEFLKGDLRTGDGNKFYHVGPVKQWSDGT
ncbi:MAG: amidohydrolase family protein, partial [Oscillospiraceae bacterium]